MRACRIIWKRTRISLVLAARLTLQVNHLVVAGAGNGSQSRMGGTGGAAQRHPTLAMLCGHVAAQDAHTVRDRLRYRAGGTAEAIQPPGSTMYAHAICFCR